MERISICDTNTGIILYDKIYGTWKADQSEPQHIASLINFFIIFNKQINNNGKIYSVTLCNQYDQKYNKHSINKQLSTNTIQQKLTMYILQHTSIIITIFINPSLYILHQPEYVLGVLCDSFIKQYSNTIQSIRSQVDSLKRTDDLLLNKQYIPLFHTFTEIIKTLNVIPNNSTILTSPQKSDQEIQAIDHALINHAQSRLRSDTIELDDIRLNQHNPIRQSIHYTDLDELNLDLQVDYNDISTTRPPLVESSVNSSMYNNTVYSRRHMTGSVAAGNNKNYYKDDPE